MKNKEPRLLIVDDNPQNLDVLAKHLEKDNYRIFVANDALDIVERVERIQPDIILLDIMMPGIDGYQASELLKDNAATAAVPIIFLTVNNSPQQITKGFAVGAVDYITKPFHQEETLARIKTHLVIYNLQRRLQEKNAALEQALQKVNLLSGLLPICSSCKKIRDDENKWIHLETYICEHSDADFTHGYCPDCVERLYGDILTE